MLATLNNKTCIAAAIAMSPPWALYSPVRGKMVFKGVMVEVVNILLKHFDLCMQDVRINDQGGLLLNNGSWTGVMGMLDEKKVDIGLAPFAISDQRARAVDYTVISMEPYNVMLKLPRVETDLFGFIKPLGGVVWIVTIFISLLLLFVQTFLQKTTTKILSRPPRAKKVVDLTVLSDLRILLGQGLTPSGETLNRYLLTVWMFACFILGAVYKSNLMAMIIAPKVLMPFDTLEQLVQTSIPFRFTEGSLVQAVFSQAPRDSIMGKVYRRSSPPLTNSSKTTSAEKLLTLEMAFITFESANKWMVKTVAVKYGECRLTTTSTTFLPVAMAFLMRKDFPLRQRFVKAITALKETGIYNKLLQDEISEASRCAKNHGVSESIDRRPLALDDLKGSFLAYGIGALMSILVLVIEIVIHAYTTRRIGGRPEGAAKTAF